MVPPSVGRSLSLRAGQTRRRRRRQPAAAAWRRAASRDCSSQAPPLGCGLVRGGAMAPLSAGFPPPFWPEQRIARVCGGPQLRPAKARNSCECVRFASCRPRKGRPEHRSHAVRADGSPLRRRAATRISSPQTAARLPSEKSLPAAFGGSPQAAARTTVSLFPLSETTISDRRLLFVARIAADGRLGAIPIPVVDRAACDARADGGLCHCCGDCCGQPRVERLG